MDDDQEQPKVGCGNAHHPDGAWHPATPMPFQFVWSERDTWGRANRQARKRYERNKARWGCGCDSSIGNRLIEAQYLLQEVMGEGNWSVPTYWNDRRKEFLAKL